MMNMKILTLFLLMAEDETSIFNLYDMKMC